MQPARHRHGPLLRRAASLGLALLLALGAPLELTGWVAPPAAAAAPAGKPGAEPDCDEPLQRHGGQHQPSFLCLFCLALGGPALAASGPDEALPLPRAAAAPAPRSLDQHWRALRPARAQRCRGPPAGA